MPAERLQKVLAQAGVASRRGAEQLIAAGRVAVNGELATIGQSADPQVDRVTLDGRPIGPAELLVHFAVHKPAVYLSSSRDERGRRSVVRLLAKAGDAATSRLWPAGRLDVESEGLLVVTNDGPWANRFLHPRFGIEREYAVLVEHPPDADQVVALLDGVPLSDGPARMLSVRVVAPPAEIDRSPEELGTWLRVQVAEGRKREVRRLFMAVRMKVLRLVRTRFGSLSLDGLRSGQWRRLTPDEVAALTAPSDAGAARSGAASSKAAPTLTVAIDGPSGSGKSTVGHALARRLDANFVDTGLMYRALTLAALERGADVDDPEALGRLAREVAITVRRPLPEQVDRRETVLLDGRDVTLEARTPRVDRAVSAVSRHAAVRAEMLEVQRAAATGEDTVMVGRDIGTVVLPNATLKVFLTASAEMRAARRAAEMGQPERVERYMAEIEQRDAADSGREVAPLRQPDDAIVLDSGQLSVEACVDAIVARLPATSVRA